MGCQQGHHHKGVAKIKETYQGVILLDTLPRPSLRCSIQPRVLTKQAALRLPYLTTGEQYQKHAIHCALYSITAVGVFGVECTLE